MGPYPLFHPYPYLTILPGGGFAGGGAGVPDDSYPHLLMTTPRVAISTFVDLVYFHPLLNIEQILWFQMLTTSISFHPLYSQWFLRRV